MLCIALEAAFSIVYMENGSILYTYKMLPARKNIIGRQFSALQAVMNQYAAVTETAPQIQSDVGFLRWLKSVYDKGDGMAAAIHTPARPNGTGVAEVGDGSTPNPNANPNTVGQLTPANPVPPPPEIKNRDVYMADRDDLGIELDAHKPSPPNSTAGTPDFFPEWRRRQEMENDMLSPIARNGERMDTALESTFDPGSIPTDESQFKALKGLGEYYDPDNTVLRREDADSLAEWIHSQMGNNFSNRYANMIADGRTRPSTLAGINWAYEIYKHDSVRFLELLAEAGKPLSADGRLPDPQAIYAQFIFDSSLKFADIHRNKRGNWGPPGFSSGSGIHTGSTSPSQSESVGASQGLTSAPVTPVGPSRRNASRQSSPVNPSRQPTSVRPSRQQLEGPAPRRRIGQ